MHRDPWERFLVLDAQYYLPLLTKTLFLISEVQQVLIWFVVYSVRNDLISFWDIPHDRLAVRLFQFCQEHKVYLNDKSIFDLLALFAASDTPKTSTDLFLVLDQLMDAFYDKARQEGLLRQFKKDYSD